jgi:hypothetical protein
MISYEQCYSISRAKIYDSINTLSLRFACNDSYRSRTSEIPIAQNLLKVITIDFDGGEIIISQCGGEVFASPVTA